MIQNDPAERSFDCRFCHGVIKIPYDLQPTKAPCPYCGEEVESPPVPSKPVVLTPVVEDEAPAVAEAVKPSAVPPALPAAAKATTPPPIEEKPVSAPKEKPKGKKKEKVAKDKAPKEKSTKPEVSKEAVQPVRAPQGPGKAGEGFQGETFEELAKESAPAPAKVKKKRKGASEKPRRKVSPLLFLGAGGVALLLVIGVLFALNRGSKVEPKPVAQKTPEAERREVERNRYLRDGWKSSASQVLRAFLEADNVEEKSKFVIGGAGRMEEMSQFYSERAVADVDTPIEAFNHEDLVLADKSRGLFLMRFDRPAQFAMKDFFRPVAPLEVQHRVEEPDPLLASMADPENFKMDQVRILAYFKEEGSELKLDWDVFVQTKYRLMKDFVENPKPGTSRIFRVRLHEDVAPHAGSDPNEVRYYRCIDPAHDSDYVKVAVGTSTTLGEHLAPLNWIGKQEPGIPSRGATLELEWTEEDEPRVYIKRLICWEYLGLGGVLGNLQLSSGTDTAMVTPAY